MERLASGLQKVLGDALRKTEVKRAPIMAWPLACGTAVAQRTRALECSAGVLRVEVPDAGWRSELRALAPQYVAVMNRYVSGKVQRIEFVLAGSRYH